MSYPIGTKTIKTKLQTVANRRKDAQREIMTAATTVFYRIGDNKDDYPPELIAEIHKQMRRIEKLFGYVPGSWGA